VDNVYSADRKNVILRAWERDLPDPRPTAKAQGYVSNSDLQAGGMKKKTRDSPEELYIYMRPP